MDVKRTEMINDFLILKKYINNWVHNESYKYADWDRKVVSEVHLSAGAIIRKDFTMNRIKNLISKHNLNLKVWEDDTMLQTDRFIISQEGSQ